MTKPGCVTQLKQLLASTVKQTKEDNGCVHYDVFHDQENPIKFFLVETWENNDAYIAHKQSAYYKQFVIDLDEVAEGSYTMELELLGC